MKKYLLLFALIFAVMISYSQKKTDLFIRAGQSNAHGWMGCIMELCTVKPPELIFWWFISIPEVSKEEWKKQKYCIVSLKK